MTVLFTLLTLAQILIDQVEMLFLTVIQMQKEILYLVYIVLTTKLDYYIFFFILETSLQPFSA